MKRLVCLIALISAVVLAFPALGQQQGNHQTTTSPLVRVLRAKGILTAEEVAQISQASSASDADERLAKLLLMKGVISQADYDQTVDTPGMINASNAGTSSPTPIAAVYRVPLNNGASRIRHSHEQPLPPGRRRPKNRK